MKKFSLARETLLALVVVTALYLPFSSISCTATSDSTKVLDGDFTGPELLEFSPNTNRVLALRFSEAVAVENINVTREDTGTGIPDVVRNVTEDQAVVELELSEPTLLGKPYRVSGIVLDMAGNSLEFSITFSGYNNEVPHLVLSEIRSEATKPRYEFIELYALSAGNLAGVTLFNASDGEDFTYEFPDLQVKKDEYIVVHYRKMPADGETLEMFVDETGNNLLASTSKESTPGRDLWIDNTKARLAKSDIILLRERSGGKLADALLYCESGKTAWKNEVMVAAAQEAYDNGLWPDGADFGAAFVADGVTATRTISRQNIKALISSPKTAECGKKVWLLTKVSSASPGEENSDQPFVATMRK